MKIGIGSAQFGLDYGVSNKNGKVEIDEVKEILNEAINLGVDLIDTASLYGNSEEVLGESLKSNHSFKIITKTPKFADLNSEKAKEIFNNSFQASLRKTKQKNIYGLLFHDANDLCGQNGYILWKEALNLKKQGLVQKIGVSVYNEKEIDFLISRYDLDIIQLPINIFDQRLIKSRHIENIKKRQIEIHARSVFLQGLLLMNLDDLDPFFNPIRSHFKKYLILLKDINATPIELALSFIKNEVGADYAICGITNKQQLLEIFAASSKNINIDFSELNFEDEDILNPSKWRLSKFLEKNQR